MLLPRYLAGSFAAGQHCSAFVIQCEMDELIFVVFFFSFIYTISFRLERRQMGAYLCIGECLFQVLQLILPSFETGVASHKARLILFLILMNKFGSFSASNDVPPAVSKRVSLSVHCK